MSVTKILFAIIFFINSYCEQLLFPNEEWYSGYIPINQNPENSLFYILFKSRQNQIDSNPLIIWLQGGPGCSSLGGLFGEHGPYKYYKNLTYARNPYSFNNFADVMYVDNPIGTGFSDIKNSSELCHNHSCVAKHFYSFLIKFIEEYPEYEKRPIYLIGQSFGGFYVTTIGAYILKANNSLINLRGISVANGDLDLSLQLGSPPDFLYDKKLLSLPKYILARFQALLCQGYSYTEKLWYPSKLCDLEDKNYGWLVNITNPEDVFENTNYENMFDLIEAYLSRNDVQNLLKVRKKPNFEICNSTVEDGMEDAYFKVTPELKFLLNHNITVLVYSGTNDLVDDWMGSLYVLENLDYKYHNEFNEVKLNKWIYENKEIGEYKRYKNLKFVKVFGAGHLLGINAQIQGMLVVIDFVKDFDTELFG